MPPTTPTTTDSKVSAKPWPAAFPPEERFWQRYSRNHEFPLSTFLAAALYVLVGFLIFFGGYFLYNWSKRHDEPLPVEAIALDAGGGGNPNGSGTGPGDRAPNLGAEATVKQDTTASPQPELKNESVEKAEAEQVKLPPLPEGTRAIADASANHRALDQMSNDARQQLLKGLKQPSPGKGGSGTGGGQGAGTGKGTGDGVGPGVSGKLNQRQKRVLRWQMYFRVVNVRDHIRQFAALGAILAVPEGENRYRVYRDLTQRLPLRGKIEDISQLNRIWFIDTYKEHPDSVAEISHALGVDPPASAVIAFFPQQLEEEMHHMEEEFRGKKEEDINETIRFDVIPRGGGYGVIVSPNQPR
jgi:hypothetical protein